MSIIHAEKKKKQEKRTKIKNPIEISRLFSLTSLLQAMKVYNIHEQTKSRLG